MEKFPDPWQTSSGLTVHIPLDEIIHQTSGSFLANVNPVEYISNRLDTSYHFSMALRTIALFVGFLCFHHALTALWLSCAFFVLGYTYLFTQDHFPFCNLVDLISFLYMSIRKLFFIIPGAVIAISIFYKNYWPALAYVLSLISTFILRFLIDAWYAKSTYRRYGIALSSVDAKAARIAYRYSDASHTCTFRTYLHSVTKIMQSAEAHPADRYDTPSVAKAEPSQKLLMTSRNGKKVWVPTDKLEAWEAAQADQSPEAIRRREKMAQAVYDMMMKLSEENRDKASNIAEQDTTSTLDIFDPIATLQAKRKLKKLEETFIEIISLECTHSKTSRSLCLDPLLAYFRTCAKSKASLEDASNWGKNFNYTAHAYSILCSLSFDLVSSGKYHVYRGMLSPQGEALYKVYKQALIYAVQNKIISQSDYHEQLTIISENISQVG